MLEGLMIKEFHVLVKQAEDMFVESTKYIPKAGLDLKVVKNDLDKAISFKDKAEALAQKAFELLQKWTCGEIFKCESEKCKILLAELVMLVEKLNELLLAAKALVKQLACLLVEIEEIEMMINKLYIKFVKCIHKEEKHEEDHHCETPICW